jgi:hypothetical protein
MKIYLLLITLLAFPVYADDQGKKDELLAGEKFADQYFRPPPLTQIGVTVLSHVIGSAPEMKTGTDLFKAGAWFQLYIQSAATLNTVVSIADHDMIYRMQVEQLWHIAASSLKRAGVTPAQLMELTSDLEAHSMDADPDPEVWKSVNK